MDAFDVINAAAAVATAAGIAAGAYQIREGKKQRIAQFEQEFVDRYRRVIADVPLELLIDEAEYDTTDSDVRRAFYDYFELCEDEVFQAHQHPPRVSPAAWKEWQEGIKSNMERPAFLAAWRDLALPSPHLFEQLRETDLVPRHEPT